MRVGDDEVVGGDTDDCSSSDKAMPAMKVWSQTGYEVMQCSPR
jgi:hypothetical protein